MSEHFQYQRPIEITIVQDERMIRAICTMEVEIAGLAAQLQTQETTMSALSDAIDGLVARIATNDQGDKARIAELEAQVAASATQVAELTAQVADEQAQIDRLNATEPTPPAA